MTRFRNAWIALALSVIATAAWADSKISLNGSWQIQGTPLGTERALDPYLALTEDRLFISGSIEIDGDRRQVIQVFDSQSGELVQTIEDVNGDAFAGHGDNITANRQFMVTSTFRGKSAGTGSLQVFDAETGSHLRTIPNPRADDSSFFGQLPMALSGSRVMAGVALTKDNQSTVWIFDIETGETVLTIDEPDNEGGFFSKAERTIFGFDKALTPTHALISARQKSMGDLRDVGAAFLFDASAGDLLHMFRPEDPQAGMFFGSGIALTDTTVFVQGSRNVAPLDWPANEISAYDVNTGALKYRLQDPYVPQTPAAVADGLVGIRIRVRFCRVERLVDRWHAGFLCAQKNAPLAVCKSMMPTLAKGCCPMNIWRARRAKIWLCFGHQWRSIGNCIDARGRRIQGSHAGRDISDQTLRRASAWLAQRVR